MVDDIGSSEDSWVELRVHGVSGTPPESLLARPHVLQIDGDDKSRFFRAVDADGLELRAADGHVVEGFHWGRYTSGTWLKALWLALVPFGLVNAATFMLPAAERPDGSVDAVAHRWRIAALAGLRLQAIFLTVVFAFAAGLLLIDIIGTRWTYRNLDSVPDGLEPLVPAAAVVVAGLVFAFFGRKLRPGTLMAGPSATLAPDPALQPAGAAVPHVPIDVDPMARRTPFARKEFYRGDTDTPALLALHVTAGLLTVALMAQRFSREEMWSSGPGLDTVVFVLLGVTVAAVLVLGDPERAATGLRDEAHVASVRRWHRFLSRTALVLLALAVVALLLAAVNVWQRGLPQPARIASEGKNQPVVPDLVIPGLVTRVNEFDVLGGWLVALGATSALVAGIPAFLLARRSRTWQASPDQPAWHFRPYSGGRASVAFANLAVLLGVGFASALVTGVSTALGLREVASLTSAAKGESSINGSTPLIDRVAYAWGLGIVVGAAFVLTWLVASRIRSGDRLAALAQVGYPRDLTFPAQRSDASPYPAPRLAAWRASLEGAIWKSRLKNRVDSFVWFVVGLGGVLAALLTVSEIARLRGDRVWGFLQPLSVYPEEVAGLDAFWRAIAPVLTQIGSWALLGLIILLVTKGRQAVKDEKTRRGVNIIWDVIAFWPHAVHPFTPTPYSQRAVVDLAERIRHHVAAGPKSPSPRRHVIVCGHSQGSLVSFAALNLLSDAELDHVGFLTFGSQLRVMFSRAFPMYVNYDTLHRMYQHLDGAWVNLYRDTDPLAGPVLSWRHVGEGAPASSHFPDPDAGERPDDLVGAYRTRRCGDDWRLADPPPRVEELQAAPVNALQGHSDYWLSPEWASALAAVRERGTPSSS